jgi:hypothetical protein
MDFAERRTLKSVPVTRAGLQLAGNAMTSGWLDADQQENLLTSC